MKKILLSLFCLSSFVILDAQTVLNETYGNPGAGKSQFIELYNSSTSGIQNVNCYTLLTYWNNGFAKNHASYRQGWYVLDFPDTSVGAKQWMVLAAASPFNVQSQVGVTAEVNWNSLAFRSGVGGSDGTKGGYLKKVYVSGGTYGDSALSNTQPVLDLFPLGDFANGQNRLLLLFKDGIFINGFWGGGSTGTLPTTITTMPNLTVTPAPGSCGAPFVVNFSSLGAVEYVNESGGADNGYARKFDGKCGSWDKTSSGNSHTPHTANGSAVDVTGLLTTSQFVTCVTSSSWPYAVANFDITAINAPATLADDFPVELQLYRDVNHNEVLDAADTLLGKKNILSVAAPADTIRFISSNGSGTEEVFFVYKTKRGCFDKVQFIGQGCATLPISLKSFTAVRNGSNVSLKWETSSEEKNSGFDVQRFIGSGNWESIGFVTSKAPDGNSSSALNYEFNDIYNAKGITQYRLKLVDMDGKSAFSMIRSIRGEGQTGKIIVYPNPSGTGKVNVSFEDANVIRDVLVIDINGRTVKQWRGTNSNNIQIDNLNAGFYTLRIFNKETGEQSVEKLIINKR